MKILAILIALATAAFAAAPVIVITDSTATMVDGSNWGQPGDVIANNPALAPAVNVALKAYIDKVKADAATAVSNAATAAAATVKAAQDAKAAAESSQAAAVAARQAAETAKAAEVAKTAAIVAALKGVNQTTLPAAVKAELLSAAAKEKAALQAQQAEIAAKLAAIP